MDKKKFIKRLIITFILLSIARIVGYFIAESIKSHKEAAWIKSMRSTFGYDVGSHDDGGYSSDSDEDNEDFEDTDDMFDFGPYPIGLWNDNYVGDAGFVDDQLFLTVYKNGMYSVINTSTGESFGDDKYLINIYNTSDFKHSAFIVNNGTKEETLYVDGKKVLTAGVINDFEFINNSGDWGCLTKDADSWDYYHIYINGKNVRKTEHPIRDIYFNPDGKRYCYEVENEDQRRDEIYLENNRFSVNRSLLRADFSKDGKETLLLYDDDNRDSYVYFRSSSKTLGPYRIRDFRDTIFYAGKTVNDWTFSYTKDYKHYVNHHGKEYGPYDRIFDAELNDNDIYYKTREDDNICFYENFKKVSEIPSDVYKTGNKIDNGHRFISSKNYRASAALYKNEKGSLMCDVYKNGNKETVNLDKAKMRTVCISPDSKYIYYFDGVSSIQRLDTDTYQKELFCKLSKEALESGVRRMSAADNLVVFNSFVCIDGKEYMGMKVFKNDNAYIYNSGENKFELIRR